MKVLIIAKWFAPMNIIGAVRPYNFADGLHKLDAKVTVVTSELEPNKEELDFNYSVVRVPYGKIEAWNKGRIQAGKTSSTTVASSSNTTPQKRTRLVAFLRRIAAQVLTVAEAFEWSGIAFKKCCEIIKQDKPDLILTTYGPIDTVLVGLKLKSKFSKIKWVADIRDALDAQQQQSWRRKIYIMIQRKMVKKSDAMITVCSALTEKYSSLAKKHNRNVPVYTIVNGFEDGTATEKPENDGILRIGYTGSLYGGLRKMDAIFEALSEIEKETGATAPVKVCYAGPGGEEFIGQAKAYGAEKYAENFGMLDRKSALSLQEKSDILCVVSWNTKKEKGILTGKFPEYLRLKKPVLALISGDVAGAELTERIDELKVGFSYEYVNKSTDFIKFIVWLKKAIHAKKENKNVCPDIKLNLIEEYSYKNLSKQLFETLESIVSK